LGAPDLPGLPRDAAGEPVFPGAWQARAFALAVELNTRGVFAWPDFAAALGAEIARDGDDYWAAWLRALEARLAAEGLAAPEAVGATTRAWLRAAEHTPHGSPIRMEAGGEGS
jgi:nitrile hydratase accessory protein